AWGAPSSRTVKSAAVRSRTSLPFLSRTTTSTTTAAVDVPQTGTSGAGGAGAQACASGKGADPAASAATVKAARDLVSLLFRMGFSPLSGLRAVLFEPK